MRTLVDNWWKVFHDLRELLYKPSEENIREAAKKVRGVLHKGANIIVYRIMNDSNEFCVIVDTAESVLSYLEITGENMTRNGQTEYKISEWSDESLSYIELIIDGKRAFYAAKCTVERHA